MYKILTEHSRKLFNFSMNYFINEIDENQLRKSAVIFSPHPDDETLGCGGTIIKKKTLEADIKIVIMTDGSRSHSGLISRNKLKSMRKANALRACEVLGVNNTDVIFLEFENRKLFENFQLAILKVKEILLKFKPDEIFIPYYKESSFWSEDHLATYKVIVSALQLCRLKIIVNEYPIGFWGHWPWTSNFSQDWLKGNLYAWKEYLSSGLYLLKDFRYCVNVENFLSIKRAALDKYTSQMTRLFSNPNWPILEDVSKGEFLKCFFQNREYFHRYYFNK